VHRSLSTDIAKFLISIDNILKVDSNLSAYYMIIGDLNIYIVGKGRLAYQEIGNLPDWPL